MQTNVISEFPRALWGNDPQSNEDGFESTLEAGRVLYFPKLNFTLSESEIRFLDPVWSDGKSKNISYRGPDVPLQGASGSDADIQALKAMVARFSEQAESLVDTLFPSYRGHLRKGFTSYRPAHVETRMTSWRKDDTRLHVDSFPSNPTGGLRLLRVFSNINPNGVPRTWRVGEPFKDYAARFAPKASAMWPGQAWALNALGLTKSKRTPYDHLMGQLHDLGKFDLDYQKTSPQLTLEIPPGATWVVFSDQVLHAVMSGQFMLEQTFYLKPEHLKDPSSGPLRILENLTGRSLLNGKT
jgi:3-deoxy-D-manno-oct-2-ulosonic acid (Kdo) hydroxylase